MQGMIRAPLAKVRERIGDMDTLPSFQEASISTRKLADYALNPQHEKGSHKARRFMATLGFDAADAAEIERQIRRQLPRTEAVKGKADKHGQRYAVDVKLTGPTGKAIVRTAWIVEAEGVPPRLVSLYVKES